MNLWPTGANPKHFSMWFSITPYAANERDKPAVATLLTAMHQASSGEPISLVITGDASGTKLLAEIPASQVSLFRAAAADLLPECSVAVHERKTTGGPETRSMGMRLIPEYLSLQPEHSFDPLDALLAALRVGRGGALQTSISLRLKPATRKDRRRAEVLAELSGRRLRVLDDLYFSLIRRQTRSANAMARLMQRALPSCRQSTDIQKLQSHLYNCELTISVSSAKGADRIAESKIVGIAGALGAFTTEKCRFVANSGVKRKLSKCRRPFLMTPVDLASLWHPPPGDSKVALPFEQNVSTPLELDFVPAKEFCRKQHASRNAIATRDPKSRGRSLPLVADRVCEQSA